MPSRPLSCLRLVRSRENRSRAVLIAGALRLPCALGRSGLTRSKREGDGATPCGTLRITAIYVRHDSWKTRSPFPIWHPITPNLGWIDDPVSFRYNRPVRLPTKARHETLWRQDSLYDIILETDWNRRPAIRGRGSAIFIHLARPGLLPTEGCLAFSRAGMRRLLPLIGRDTRILIG